MEYDYIIDLEKITEIQKKYDECCKKFEKSSSNLSTSALATCREGIISSLYGSLVGRYNEIKSFNGNVDNVWAQYIRAMVNLENNLAKDDRLETTITIDPTVIINERIPRYTFNPETGEREWTDNSDLLSITAESILSKFNLHPDGEIDEKAADLILEIYTNPNISDERKEFIIFGLQWVGKIRYKVGGHVTGAGEIPTTLDCSHYVDFVAMNTLEDWSELESWQQNGATYTLVSSKITTGVNKEELQPGDLGFKYLSKGEQLAAGDSYNHVGIYLGTDENGNALWLHETAGNGDYNVIVSTINYFNHYRSLNPIN